MDTRKQDTSEKQSPIQHLAAFIVDKRKVFYLLFIGLCIFCVFSSGWVSVNDDLTSYLPEETETRRGLTAMDAEFVTFGDSRVILISDSMRACGLPDGQYTLGGQDVTVRGARAELTEHPETIAGSVTDLYACMRRAVLEMGVPLESALRAASENPARSIGVEADYGSLAPGRWGNVILADEKLEIRQVIQKGRVLPG